MKYTDEKIITEGGILLLNYLPDIGIDQVKEEILSGLKDSPKHISSKYFYDERGSELFEQITQLDEYYPTRTEKSILCGGKFNIDFPNLNIIDLGSGDTSKIRLLLQQIPKHELPTINYYPLDISASAIQNASEKLAVEFPVISITGIVADFMHHLDMAPKADNRLFCFFGSTIGNFKPAEVLKFMRLLVTEMKAGEHLLMGMDMVKDSAVLEKAYNDDRQITAEFNKNILQVINNLVDTNFDPSEFEHLAFYNREHKRIEMHLKAVRDMVISVNSGTDQILINKDETIHTENSYKFTQEDLTNIGSATGLAVEQIYTDDNRWFSLVHYIKH